MSMYGNKSQDIGYRAMNNTSRGGVTWMNLGNFVDTFHTDIFCSLSSQIDTLHIIQKYTKVEKYMAIFCPNCRKNYP